MTSRSTPLPLPQPPPATDGEAARTHASDELAALGVATQTSDERR